MLRVNGGTLVLSFVKVWQEKRKGEGEKKGGRRERGVLPFRGWSPPKLAITYPFSVPTLQASPLDLLSLRLPLRISTLDATPTLGSDPPGHHRLYCFLPGKKALTLQDLSTEPLADSIQQRLVDQTDEVLCPIPG